MINRILFLAVLLSIFSCKSEIKQPIIQTDNAAAAKSKIDSFDFKHILVSKAVSNHYSEATTFYENLNDFDIDPYLDSIDTTKWQGFATKDSSGLITFLESNFNEFYSQYANLEGQEFNKENTPESINPLLKDQFEIDGKIIKVEKAKSFLKKKKWDRIKKNRFYGQAIYNNKDTDDESDDELTIVVHVKEKIDIDQVLIFIIYHELGHFVLNHANKDGYNCKLSSENEADCFASETLFNHNGGQIVIGATAYAFRSVNRRADNCHDSFKDRYTNILNCAQ